MILSRAENLAKMQRVAEFLSGTCCTVEEGLSTEFGEDADLVNFDIPLLEALDAETMCCEGCGWWVSPDELNEDQLCGDCQAEAE